MTPMPPMPLVVFDCPLTGIVNVEASAGTGKTWNICGLYLRLIVEQKRKPSEILVVTFTEAATAELRDRIRARLAEVWRALQYDQMPGGDPFVTDFIDQCIDSNRPGKTALTRKEAGNLIETAMLSFDEAAIFTIHGFCHRALSESAFVAGMPFENEVATDGAEFIEQVAQDFWRQKIMPQEGSLALALIDYFPSESKANRTSRKKKEASKPIELPGLAGILKEIASRPLAHLKWPIPPPPSDEKMLQTTLAAARQALQNDIEPALNKLKEGIAAKVLKATYKSPQLIDAAGAAWKKALARPEVDFRELHDAGLLLASCIAKGTYSKKVPPTDPLFDTLEACYRELERQFHDLEYQRIRLLQQFVAEAPGKLQQAKQRARVITFDDMLRNLHAALAGNTAVANLPQILRHRFPCALIDEFQDTDPLQLAIFRAIYGAEGPLFLVGDPKQAIYSFRGADLHTYLSARDSSQERFTLAHNQRSGKAMIDAVNALFGAHDRPFRIEKLDFVPADKGAKPIPELIDETGIERAALSVWQLQGGTAETPLLKRQARQQVIKATVAEIVRLLDAGQRNLICIGDRGLQPRDIALLVRTNRQGQELKAELAAAGVNAVELSQSDVFASFEAEEIERVLLAVADPANTRHLLGALATVLIGLDSKEIDRLNGDDQLLGELTAKFHDYRETWQKHGFGRLWRDILSGHQVIERLLPLPAGERRATNLSHLAELLAVQFRRQPGIESLLKWFVERRNHSDGAETRQLRLESDQNLVQIVTKHRSKGLEYPIVFCPFAWDDGKPKSASLGLFDRYHDPQSGKTVLDFRCEDSAKIAVRNESAEERLRLLYVALTRSIHRCYIAGGTHLEPAGRSVSRKASARSALNWLVAGKGQCPATWDEGGTSFEHIEACWQEVVRQSGGSMAFLTLQNPDELSLLRLTSTPQATQYMARTISRRIPGIAWHLESYSGLLRQQPDESANHAAVDHDATLKTSMPIPAVQPTSVIPENDILRFPRGTKAGECVHTVFEKADFTRPEKWPEVIDKALQRHFGSVSAADAMRLQTMFRDVLDTSLPGGWKLKDIPPQRRLAEFDFFFTVTHLKAVALFDLLEQHGWSGKRLNFASLNGFMRGSIDFVGEHEGRWYLIDWKSNHLGDQADDYAASCIDETMREASYDLQALIYVVALHRYLRMRLGERYDAENHLGGALYLFVRGVRPDWAGKGIWHWQPTAALVESLDALFSSQDSGPTKGRSA